MIDRAWVTVALMVIGAAVMLLASVGIVRMPDVYSRMQAATKASALGAGSILVAVAVHFGDLAITTRALLIVAFIFLTAPVSGHLIGRAAYYAGVPLWEGTTRDELRGRGDRRAHTRDSGPREPPRA